MSGALPFKLDGQNVGQIDAGMLVLLGVAQDETDYLTEGLRIFEDADGTTNLSMERFADFHETARTSSLLEC